MASQDMQTLKRAARIAGAIVMILALSGAEGGIPFSIEGLLYAAGAALVVWGTTKAKIDRLECEMEKKVSFDVYHASNVRLDRLEDKLDRLLERP